MLLYGTILLPVVAGFLCFAMPRDNARLAKIVGALVALASLVMVVAGNGQEASLRWLSRPFVATFHVGDAGIAFWLALLLTLCTLCAIAATNISRQRDFIGLMLLLEGTMLGLFLVRDLLAFALFWDLMLLPVFFCLMIWGKHHTTAWRYFIYNFAGGLTLLLATAAFGMLYGSTDVIGRADVHLVGSWVPWIFGGFAFAFLVKTPVWPLHTWMPNTYSELPAPMVAVVGAVQSKAGLYGFIAIAMAFMPDYMKEYAGVLIVLSVISLLYGAFTALAQTEAKRIVAYSSLSHLGLIVLALASFNGVALQGAVVYLIAHGLFTAALFLILGYIQEREETLSLTRLRGLGAANPRLTGAFCIAALAALGLPGLAGFVGEIVILTGTYQAGLLWPTLIALIPIVLAAAYMLRLFQGAMNGPQVADLPVRRDLTWLEGLAVAPLLAALVYVGVNPHALTTFNTAAYSVATHTVAEGPHR